MSQKKSKTAGGGRKAPERPPQRRRRRFVAPLMRWTAVGVIWLLFLGFCLTAWFAYDLPDVSRLNEIQRKPSVTLLTEDGAMLASYGDLYGTTVKLADLPPYLPQALLATEDRRFYSHFGLDVIGLARAVYVNIRSGQFTQGGSTITQQLAKNVFLTPERTIRRKGQELLLALWLERNFSKDEILELYLNRVYFGAGTYGVDAAARKYFGKPAAKVSPYEAAMLAGMVKAPSRYNPLADRKLADQRARLVLQNMVTAGYLTAAQAKQAAQGQAGAGATEVAAPTGQHFADWVLDQVSSYVGYSDRDLVVVTTLDPALQRQAEATVAGLLDRDGDKRKASQAALVAMTPDGAVRAMVGGRDYDRSQFNRATQALRQPGSAFKAFVFLAALESGLTPDSHLVDGPISVGNWHPHNYNDKYYGDVTLREAFARSLNSVAVQLSQKVGPRAVVDVAKRLGITSTLSPDRSIALGTSEVTLLDLTAAYGVFANQGKGVWPRGIEEIRDSAGNLLYRRSGSGPDRVASARNVAQMQDMMSAVVAWGTGKGAAPGRPAAGKTGTSQDFRDAWFVGFTAELVAGVWVGNDDGTPMDKVTGGVLPARLWRDFMVKALHGQPVRPLPAPPVEAAVASSAPAPSSPPSAAIPLGQAAQEGQSESLRAFLDRLNRTSRKD